MNAADVRRLIGPTRIVGVSAGTIEEALIAEQDGADYIGGKSRFFCFLQSIITKSLLLQFLNAFSIHLLFAVGSVFATSSKSDAGEPIGIDSLRSIVQKSSIPVVAIGGINCFNAAECISAGSAGIAVISAILASPNITQEAFELSSLIKQSRKSV
mmetsp:Transcript_6638/g.11851  ORF Transcript_6638/g.11851 Transcript_6638/m.11851 type:complete len:156 (+) Transcript_6638:617-1084(+)